MMLFQSAQLVRLERKKRGLETGEKRRPKYQDPDREQENSENASRHFSLRRRLRRNRVLSEKLQHARLPIISATVRVKLPMTKGERISQMVETLEGKSGSNTVAENGFYRAYFRLWNEQDYYQAHDVLEHIWLETTTDDARYFKGLIQAAGAFVHLKKQFEHPSHPKHGRRLQPAVRLFRLALKNLAGYGPVRHAFEVPNFREMLENYVNKIVHADYKKNPWSPGTAPMLRLRI
jgi:Domain of unknown function (DUF309)